MARRGLQGDPAQLGELVDAGEALKDRIRDLRQGAQDSRPITDIALSWGFNNLSYFSRVFREHTGCSPSEYRTTSRTRLPAA